MPQQEDLAAIADITLEYVTKEVQQWLPKYAVFMNLVMTRNKGSFEDVNGRGFYIPGEMFQNAGVGMFAEGGAHPIAGNRLMKRMTGSYKRYMISCRLTADVLQSQGKNVLGNVLPDNVASDIASLMQYANEDVYQDATGVKGIVGTGTATTSLVLKTPTGAQNMHEYGRYNIVTTAGVQRGSSEVYVVQPGIDYANKTVTLDQAVATSGAGGAVAVGDLVVPENSALKGLSGLKLLIDNSTSVNLQGLSRSTYPRLKSVILGNGGSARPLSTALFDLITNTLLLPRSKGPEVYNDFNAFMWICHPNARNQYQQLAQNAGTQSYPLKRFDGATKELDLGYDVISYGGKKFMIDPHCPMDKMWYGDWNKIDYYEFLPGQFVPYTGREYGMTFVPNFSSAGAGSMADAEIYSWGFKGDLGIKDPGPFARIDDIDYTGFATGFF